MLTKETHTRSVTKGITWRIIASLTTMGLVYIFSGSLKLVIEVGILDVLLKLFFYYAHERAWGNIKWGIHKSILGLSLQK